MGQTVEVDGSTAPLKYGSATWLLSAPKPVTATGQTVYSGNYSIAAGNAQLFTWDDNYGSALQWPDGNYTIAISAKDSDGQPVAIPTEIEGVVGSAGLTQTPPVLSIAGQITRSTSSACRSQLSGKR